VCGRAGVGLSGWRLIPIAAGPAAAQAWSMVQLAIHYHPRVPSSRNEPPLGSAEKRRGSTVEEMGECSFPASDPPAVWTWEVGENSAPPGLSDKTA
jgi:hypothetical protein